MFSRHPTALLPPTLSFLWALPACPPLSFLARDGSNSFLINSSCWCNGGVGDGAEWPNPLLAIYSFLYGCRKSSTEGTWYHMQSGSGRVLVVLGICAFTFCERATQHRHVLTFYKNVRLTNTRGFCCLFEVFEQRWTSSLNRSLGLIKQSRNPHTELHVDVKCHPALWKGNCIVKGVLQWQGQEQLYTHTHIHPHTQTEAQLCQ